MDIAAEQLSNARSDSAEALDRYSSITKTFSIPDNELKNAHRIYTGLVKYVSKLVTGPKPLPVSNTHTICGL